MRYLLVTLILILYAAFCCYFWLRFRRRHKNQCQSDFPHSENLCLVAYASQTGQAEKIAELTVQQLQQAKLAVKLLPLNRIRPADLQRYKSVLFIVSTYGEGEAPDNGGSFIRRLHQQKQKFPTLEYAVLALGDSNYANYCGFGHQVNRAMIASGAQAAYDLIEVDKGDESALRHWQYYLGQLSGQSEFSDWTKPGYETWQLCERQCLNPDGVGAPVYFLRLKPKLAAEALQWTAGDIAEIGPYNNSDLPHREYSIASTPTRGSLDLLVRQVHKKTGELGLGSGWLTQVAPEGGDVFLRIRRNSSFHPPTDDRPIILIGNGTGIAGLRAHLLARIERGLTKNWLLFGERNATQDFYFRDELRQWQTTGMLQRLDVVFSREQATPLSPRYVQDLLPKVELELRHWVAQGAAIYVCGSLQGMAQGVDDALTKILGRSQVEQMTEARRYCRDIY